MFPSKKDVQLHVCSKSVQEKKPFKVVRSDAERYVVCCPVDSCDFSMCFYKRMAGLFHLIRDVGHTCNSLIPSLKRMWVRNVACDYLKGEKRMTPSQLQDSLRRGHGVNVGNVMASNSLADAKKEDRQASNSFGLIASFLNALAGTNHGTTTSLCYREGTFQRAFLALAMCVRAFSHSTRVLGLDVCHLKTAHGGVLLVLTILDGNGQIIPGALGIAESENVHTWKWFLALVKTGFHVKDDGLGLVFLADREKGLEDGLRELLPNAAHSFWVYHNEKNVKDRYKTSVEGLLFNTAKTPDKNVFETVLQRIDSIHREAGKFIRKNDAAKWARSYFPAHRFGHVTSNISESMNWWQEEARHFNPVELFTAYIRKLNTLFERRRNK